MKKASIALFLGVALGMAHGQASAPPDVTYVAVAPSGACASAPPIQVVISTGTAYTCNNGTWAAVSGGGGGNATTVNGLAIPASQPCVGTNGSSQFVAGTCGVLSPAGVIYQSPSPITGLLSGWAANGATPTYSANSLVFAGLGANPSIQTYDYTYVTQLPVWSVSCTITLGVIAATDQGIGCGIRSTGTFVANSFGAWLDDSTTQTNSGKLVLFNAGSSQAVLSSATSTMTAGDVWTLVATRNWDTLTVTATNTTTKVAPLTASIVSSMAYGYSPTMILPNVGHFAMMAFGTTPGAITAVAVNTQQPANVSYACMGDSKTAGYYQGTYQQSWCQLLSNTYGYNVTNFSGGGDTSADMVANLPEIVAYHPSTVFLACCSNDTRSSVAIGTTEANYANIVTTLTGAGINVYELQSFYETGISQTTLDAYIAANYPATYITNPGTNYTASASSILAADNIHPNSFYATLIAASINSFLYPGAPKVSYSPYSPQVIAPAQIGLPGQTTAIVGNVTLPQVTSAFNVAANPLQNTTSGVYLGTDGNSGNYFSSSLYVNANAFSAADRHYMEVGFQGGGGPILRSINDALNGAINWLNCSFGTGFTAGSCTFAAQENMPAIGGTGTATFAVGAGAGTTPGTPVCTTFYKCDSLGGTMDLTMGTATPTTGTLLTYTTTITRAKVPTCLSQVRLKATPYTLLDTTTMVTPSGTTVTVSLTGTAATASTAYTIQLLCPDN